MIVSVTPTSSIPETGDEMNINSHDMVSVVQRCLGSLPTITAGKPAMELVSGYSLAAEPTFKRALNRKQIGSLYADITSCATLDEHDEQAAQGLLADYLYPLCALVMADKGQVKQLTANSIYVEFDSAARALRGAIKTQLAIKQWNAVLSLHRQLRFRIGVNLHEVNGEDDESCCHSSKLAAQLEQLPSSGGIYVSDSIRSELLAHPSYHFIDMGKRYVKHISEPVQVFWIEYDVSELDVSICTGAASRSVVAQRAASSDCRDRCFFRGTVPTFFNQPRI
jgi:class 3 adenylate cyclase